MRSVEVFGGDLQREVTEWRRYLHENPELDFREHNTAKFVAEKLASFGINHIETGIAETGIVALIQGEGGDGPTIGLRADMDALPIVEASNKPWSSKNAGVMHACGHDGHTAMLLGAAKYLASMRKFKGSVALIFQPAEEPEFPTGGFKMVQEGIMDRFDISQVFGMHNSPGLEIGKFAICHGSMMGSQDDFDIVVKGMGGHAASPHRTVDPVVIAAQIIIGLQSLVSRKTDPRESLVISVTKLRAAQAYNVIPDQVEIAGTVRTLSSGLRDFAEQEILAAAQGIARAFGADVEFRYLRSVPAVFNDKAGTDLAIQAARSFVGSSSVNDRINPSMGAEDFSYMLEARPGAYILLGNGLTANVHHPAYDFNDDALPYGIGYWVNLVETVLDA
ncbi:MULTISPECIES: M20 aminoacylase family protein [unclassified Mesorhizobium]|uniref:M20 aminoacylase family protein n=1 Tax=unclassified Mesorhizobium TaxID=325217 RepID=UPI0003CF16F4|nr:MULTISPECIES: M20 aminoacylase family protein [unclassified Mesorhizobium]ESY46599.1 N-acyl-L-amino acid amidohydrolase [Mesorhizobium sp. LNJC374B00]ESY52336.1 N-acyl-L-amino acid amidohydrolase [Mesorhizobium sp. LNJC372A00]WJI81076.1 M20 family metallopeptidase [Mesorhizobium sp. C374B]WJI87617.1 M20 family metallopeptidase [Mesorhizobium sp. C372A]